MSYMDKCTYKFRIDREDANDFVVCCSDGKYYKCMRIPYDHLESMNALYLVNFLERMSNEIYEERKWQEDKEWCACS